MSIGGKPYRMETLPAKTSFSIRPMRMEDLDRVNEIDRLSFSIPWPPSAYRFEIKDNPASLPWVAEALRPDSEKQVVGLIVVWLIMDEAHIATIAVHPDYRHRGIGRTLLAFALQASIGKGATQATLEVRSNNLSAQQLYHELGFEVVSRRTRYYHDTNEDALLMTAAGFDQGYLERLEGYINHNAQVFRSNEEVEDGSG